MNCEALRIRASAGHQGVCFAQWPEVRLSGDAPDDVVTLEQVGRGAKWQGYSSMMVGRPRFTPNKETAQIVVRAFRLLLQR